MDLYYQLPVNHPLRLSLPEENAKVAIAYCNLTPYRIILWKRLLNFLFKDGSLDQIGYDRLKLVLPADEDALKAWVYCMVNYSATVPGGADDMKEIIIKVENVLYNNDNIVIDNLDYIYILVSFFFFLQLIERCSSSNNWKRRRRRRDTTVLIEYNK